MKRKKTLESKIENLAQENKCVSRSVDGLVEYVSSQNDADLRSDWPEIQKTTDLILLQDLVFGQDCAEESSHTLKKNRKPDGGRKPEKENNL